METLTELIMSRVDAFLERTGVGPPTLGRQAVGDPNLARQLRRDGRSPTLATVDQVMAFMEAYDEAPSGDLVVSRTGRLRDPASRARRGRPMTSAMERGMDAPARATRHALRPHPSHYQHLVCRCGKGSRVCAPMRAPGAEHSSPSTSRRKRAGTRVSGLSSLPTRASSLPDERVDRSPISRGPPSRVYPALKAQSQDPGNRLLDIDDHVRLLQSPLQAAFSRSGQQRRYFPSGLRSGLRPRFFASVTMDYADR